MQNEQTENMNTTGIIFPHQLFKKNPAVAKGRPIYLIEEFLFFRQYNFHKQKILLHRASMKFYENYLQTLKHKVTFSLVRATINFVTSLIDCVVSIV